MFSGISVTIPDEEIKSQLMAQGQMASPRQIAEVSRRISENVEKHDIKRELIGRAIKDIGIINLKRLDGAVTF